MAKRRPSQRLQILHKGVAFLVGEFAPQDAVFSGLAFPLLAAAVFSKFMPLVPVVVERGVEFERLGALVCQREPNIDRVIGQIMTDTERPGLFIPFFFRT